MEWAVVYLSGTGNMARCLTRADSPERKRKVVGAQSVTAPAEMR